MGPSGQGMGLQVPRGSRNGPTGSQGVKEWAYRVPLGKGMGLQGLRGSRCRPNLSKGVKG